MFTKEVYKMAKGKKFVFWTSRILAILFILFLAVFSLDAFGENAGFLGTILALFIHNIPSIILLILLIISWKHELVGAISFITAGVLYIVWLLLRPTYPGYILPWSLMVAGPAFLIGILFFIGWEQKKKNKKREMKKRINWKILILSLLLVYFAAFIGSLFSFSAVNSSWYQSVKPVITPPNWVFPIVWTALFFLIALSAYFSWMAAKNEKVKKKIIILFGVNLILNSIWSCLFFGLQAPLIAFIDIILLLGSIIWLFVFTETISKKALWLLAPYFFWVCFATVLNAIIAFS